MRMQIEYEATFIGIDKEDIRKRLKKAGAELVHPERLQKRITFHPPQGKRAHRGCGWVRVRDEGDKITVSMKRIVGDSISDQQEACITANDYTSSIELLEALGCVQKSYQESKRETWILDGVEITIDTWPHLDPYIEVEGSSEDEVKQVSEKLGFDYADAKFCSADKIYADAYNVSPELVYNDTPRITFTDPNPFI